ncbi:MAG: RNase P modulator RnpM [Acutalibacteraceae bacterium]
MHQKKVPMRKCVGCGEMKEKKQLVRIVKAPDTTDENGEIIQKGVLSVDITGKKSGRGAYICRNPQCLAAAKKARRLEKTFSCKMPDEIYDDLEKQLSGE